jgi:trans-aconitate methyltransferase
MLADMGKHRETARASFDAVALLYDEARPGYPAAVYDDLITLAQLAPNAQLFEIGAGTGHATLPLAQRGYRIDCVELGEQMANVARSRLAPFPSVSVTVADFDRWTPETRYELAFAASAYHWLNPATRLQQIAALLTPHGHIAVFRNHHIDSVETAAFNAAVQQVYRTVLGSSRDSQTLPRCEAITPVEATEWQASGQFSAASTRLYHWQQKLSAVEYIRQLGTHSDHRMLSEIDRNHLFDKLEKLIDDDFGGIAVKHYVTLLQIAQKIR